MAVTVDHIDHSREIVAISEPRALVRAGAVVAALLAVAVYASTLRYGFVSDDVPVLMAARSGHGPLDWHRFLLAPGEPERGGVTVYRPLTLWSFALVEELAGPGPLGHHLASVVLHAAASATVVVAAAATGVPVAGAVVAGALFAVHPIHTEAVSHVASRADVLGGLLALLALAGWSRALAGLRPAANSALAIVAFGLALLASEQTIPLLVLLPVADLAAVGLRPRGDTGAGRRIVFYGALLAITAGYFMLRRVAVAGAPPPDQTVLFQANPVALSAPPIRMLTALRFLALAAGLLFAPLHLSATYSYHQYAAVESMADPGALAGVAVGLGVLILGVVLWLRSRSAFFWLLFAVLSYAAVSNVPFVTGALFREDRLYLPSAGFCALIALLLVWALGSRVRSVGLAVATVLVVVAGVLAVQRNPIWRDELSLALATVEAAPESTQGHRMLGAAYVAAGRDDDALQQFQRVLGIYPTDKSSLYNVGVLLQRHDQPIEALSVLRQLADIDPKFAPAWINIAAINNTQTAFAPALDAADRAISIRPDIPNAHIVRGFALRGLRRFKDARGAFEEALRLAPSHPEALLGLGATSVDLEDWDLCIRTFQQLLSVAPVHDAYRGVVFCLRQSGRGADASEVARTAREKFPDDEFFQPEGPPVP